MKKLFCEVCEEVMNSVFDYDSDVLNPKTVEVHQCTNKTCKQNRILKHYWINKNRAVLLGTTTSAEPKF